MNFIPLDLQGAYPRYTHTSWWSLTWLDIRILFSLLFFFALLYAATFRQDLVITRSQFWADGRSILHFQYFVYVYTCSSYWIFNFPGHQLLVIMTVTTTINHLSVQQIYRVNHLLVKLTSLISSTCRVLLASIRHWNWAQIY